MFLWRADLASNPKAAMPESKTNTLEVLIMNTKFSFDRRNVLTISILVTAFWLPLATFAQGLTETESLEQDVSSRAADCAHCVNISDPQELRNCKKSRDTMAFWEISDPRVLVDRVGFSEEDPTKQQLGNVGGSIETDSSQKQNKYAGFAETDPAKILSFERTTLAPSTSNESQHVYAGFSETTPAADISQEVGVSPYRAFVDCLNENASGVVFESPEFSSLTEKEYDSEHC